MSHNRFEDDPVWLKFKCFEVASERNKYRNIEAVISDAKKIEKYILPKATVLKIKGGKDAQKNHHQ